MKPEQDPDKVLLPSTLVSVIESVDFRLTHLERVLLALDHRLSQIEILLVNNMAK